MKVWTRLVVCACMAAVIASSGPPLLARQDAASPDGVLLEAKRLYDALEYELAVTALDRVVGMLEAKKPLDGAPRAQLSDAYELRARTRFMLNDRDGTRNDFRSLLTLNPGRGLTAQVSPNVVAIFAEIKKAIIGAINLTIAPADAEVQIDGVSVSQVNGVVPIVAGPHTIAARQAGYRPGSETVSVSPGATVDLALVLERVSATINLMTVPADVEVVVDGVSRGSTAPGPPPAEYADAVRALGVPSAAVSRPFILADIPVGGHVIELRKDCYVKSENRIDVQKPMDYRLDPIKLTKAVASVIIDAGAGSVFIDGLSRGAAPVTANDVCEGSHVVEVRSAMGRYVKRIDVKTGDTVPIHAELRPAVAILSTTGLPEGLRGGSDLRLAVERFFQNAKSVTVFAPPAEQVDQALAREKLAPGWLSYDTAKRPIGEAAANITATGRQDLSARLAKTIDVQAVAVVTVPSRDDRLDVFITMLAAGSGDPDTIRVKLDNADSVGSAIARLDKTPTLFRPSAGLQVADVLDVPGAVVVAVEPGGPAARAGIGAGDVIGKANGQPVADGLRLAALIAAGKADDTLALEARDQTGAVKRADVRLGSVPQLVAMADETILFNKLLLDFRTRLLAPASPVEESVTRLNLGVALMRVGSWSDAHAELERVRLADSPGVGSGTVQYLIGLCREALGQSAEAQAAWRAAAASNGALLTSEGPAIKELAEKKLADLARRTGKPGV
jgi:hypothetical protein